MCLNHVREVFYGGAAGGGKSDWLLMEALQYVDCKDYHAKIFRLTLADADNESSIMFRAREWLVDTDAKQEKGGQRWRFPSGATLAFGGMDQKDDHLKQQGAEFAFLGWDELTQFKPHQFEYVVNSRLRKPTCQIHKDQRNPSCDYCKRYWHTAKFPLRVRCASNPGNRGHLYVKRRYDIGKIPGMRGPAGEQLYAGRFTSPRIGKKGRIIQARPHIAAFVHDNPFLDVEDYTQQLSEMSDPVTMEQLLAGNWAVVADARFRRAWLKRWRYHGIGKDGRGTVWLDTGTFFDIADCYQIIIVDPASSTKDTPGRTLIGKKASWTVISRWIITPQKDALLIHVERVQEEMPDIIPNIKQQILMGRDSVRTVGMEFTAQSTHLYQQCQREGLPMFAFKTQGKDKVSRSFDAATRMKEGKILLPDPGPPWLDDYEDEIFTWTGADDETDDQVDVTAYLGIWLTQNVLGSTSAMSAH